MKRWRVSSILTGLIVCILGIYIMGESKSQILRSFKVRALQGIEEYAEQTYLPGIAYSNKRTEHERADKRLAEIAMNMIPLGGYINGKENGEIAVEDEATYDLLVKKQAQDENAVDENGNLIGEDVSSQTQPAAASIDLSIEKLRDFDYLVSNFYTVDSVTMIEPSDLNVDELLAKNMKINAEEKGPKVLIYHTHSQEAFVDSDGDPSTSIVGVGRKLTDLLNNKYGIETIHHEGVYDLINGKLDRSEAYELAAPEISNILKENPSIEVVIDLHRDGVGENTHLVTDIGGKQTAQIMFFNGMSRTRANGDLSGMPNPNIQDNLAFSLQMKLKAEELYPGFTRHIYLKGYRYNMNLMPKMLLIEAGAQTNTVEEMMNAMEPLAETLSQVLK